MDQYQLNTSQVSVFQGIILRLVRLPGHLGIHLSRGLSCGRWIQALISEVSKQKDSLNNSEMASSEHLFFNYHNQFWKTRVVPPDLFKHFCAPLRPKPFYSMIFSFVTKDGSIFLLFFSIEIVKLSVVYFVCFVSKDSQIILKLKKNW